MTFKNIFINSWELNIPLNILNGWSMQCLFFEQTRRNIAGSNKPNTLSANFSLIYISERVIKQ